MGEIEKPQRRIFCFSHAVALVCGVGLVWLSLSPTAHQRQVLAKRARVLQAEGRELRQERQRLINTHNALRWDPAAIEREARNQMGYLRPGEEHYPVPTSLETEPAGVRQGRKSSGVLAAIPRSLTAGLQVVLIVAIMGLLIALLWSPSRGSEASPTR